MTIAFASRRLTVRRAITLLAVLALVAALVWLQRRPVEVDAVAVRTQPLQRTLLFSARVQTPARVEVGATLTGRVARVLVDEGDAVAAGAPLLQLEEDRKSVV